MPRGQRHIFTMKRYELIDEIKHPRYVIENVEYKDTYFKIMGWRHPWIKIGRSIEELLLNIRYGNILIIQKSLSQRIKKWIGRDKHL